MERRKALKYSMQSADSFLKKVHCRLRTVTGRVVRLAGFEPAAYGLEVRCSIQLSYRRTWKNLISQAWARVHLKYRAASGTFNPKNDSFEP